MLSSGWERLIPHYDDAVPPDGAGITYYAGHAADYPDKPPVNCLLFWAPTPDGARLRIVGLLQHFSVDYPPGETAGNVNIWVRRSHQRRGVATALWGEAVRRWNVTTDDQMLTPDGARLAATLTRPEQD